MTQARTHSKTMLCLAVMALCAASCGRAPAGAQASAPAADRAPCCAHKDAQPADPAPAVPAEGARVPVPAADDPLAGPSIGAAGAGGFVKVVNAFCPIMQRKAVEGEVPADLTRALDGEIIGVCCDECAGAWDALTDAERRERVQAVRPMDQPAMAPR